jgi:hypothetical protein
MSTHGIAIRQRRRPAIVLMPRRHGRDHAWEVDGQDEDRVCARCAMRSSWPGAKVECTGIGYESAEKLADRYQRRKAARMVGAR